MNRRNAVMIALGALVAGAAALVYAEIEGGNLTRGAAPEAALAAGETGQIQAPLYDFNALPDPVKRMLERIAEAAQTGEIENLRAVVESNELKPMVAAPSERAYSRPPITYGVRPLVAMPTTTSRAAS